MATTKTSPSPLELARIGCGQARRLVDDAKARADAASQARAAADEALAKASTTAAAAVAASAANRDSDPHADVAARELVRKAHAEKDLLGAIEAHATAVEAVRSAEEGHKKALARRDYEQAKDDFVHNEVAFRAAAAEDGKKIVSAVHTLVTTIRDMRERIADHNEVLSVFHQFGGDASVPKRDGAAHAGTIYAAMYEANATLHVTNPHELRYLTDLPSRLDAPNADPYDCARQLAYFILSSFAASEKNAKAGVERRGWLELKQAAAHFSSSRTGHEAAQRMNAANDAAGREREAKAKREHERRLSKVAADEVRFPATRARREDGSIIGPVIDFAANLAAKAFGETASTAPAPGEAPPVIPAIDNPPDDLTVG
jgi:hypothetical protein